MALDQAFFLDRAQALFPDLFAELAVGLSAHQAQAKIMEACAQAEDALHTQCTIDDATGPWLDLHAAGVGMVRGDGENDTQLRERVRQGVERVSPNAVLAAIQRVGPVGVRIEILEGLGLAYWPQDNGDGTANEDHFIGFDPVYRASFDGPVYDAIGDARISIGGNYSKGAGVVGTGLVGDGAGGTVYLDTRENLPAGVTYEFSGLAKGAHVALSGALSGAPFAASTATFATSDGSAPGAMHADESAGTVGETIDELAIVCTTPLLIMGDTYGDDTANGSIVIHVGAPALDTSIQGLGTLGATPQSDDFCLTFASDLAPRFDVSSYLALLAAVLAVKAAGVPVKLWLDPYFV